MHTLSDIHTHIHSHIQTHSHTYTHTHKHTHTYTLSCTHTFRHTLMNLHTHTHIQTNTHSYTCTHTLIHSHTLAGLQALAHPPHHDTSTLAEPLHLPGHCVAGRPWGLGQVRGSGMGCTGALWAPGYRPAPRGAEGPGELSLGPDAEWALTTAQQLHPHWRWGGLQWPPRDY